MFFTAAFKSNFNPLEVAVKRLLRRAETLAVLATKEIMEGIELKLLWKSYSLEESLFLEKNPVLIKLGSQQINQFFGGSLVVHTYAMRDYRISDVFLHVFRGIPLPVNLLKSARNLQHVFDNKQAKRED